jgi:hypothetical protein
VSGIVVARGDEKTRQWRFARGRNLSDFLNRIGSLDSALRDNTLLKTRS